MKPFGIKVSVITQEGDEEQTIVTHVSEWNDYWLAKSSVTEVISQKVLSELKAAKTH